MALAGGIVWSEQDDACVNLPTARLHDGPGFPERELKGSEAMARLLENSNPTVVVRGHAAWRERLARMPNGTQVVSAEAGVILLTRPA